ncbi:forkhead box transcription factor [Aspergillus undulatus]|uniref:forkhead box transcription factor n=1 Tax=Aspergillus undulatus TaxID=1810928 RepID=UPI003CCCD4F8
MNRFSSSRPGSVLDQKPLYQSQSSTSSSSRSPESPSSVFDGWSDSSSSTPEAMMPEHQPWVSEPAMNNNCSLFQAQSPIEPPSDGLPRMIPPMGCRPLSEWPNPLLGSNYSSSRQLRPEVRRLPTGNRMPDWGQVKSEAASMSLYKASHSHPQHNHHGSLGPHSQSSTNPTTTTSLSPTSTAGMSYHSLPLSVVSPPMKLEMSREVAVAPKSSDEAEDANADPPYSQLIYEALLAAPGKRLPLQGIYQWFEENTAKGRDRGSKGWQNSIRHNLSMNAGFEAVREESTPGKKAINYWRLTDEAVNNGIQSTTRYRKNANYKRPTASDPPAPQRQRSGAKGGKATKITNRFRSINGNGFSSNGMNMNTNMNYMSYGQDEYQYHRDRERAYRYQQHLLNPQPHSQSQQPPQPHQRIMPPSLHQRRLPNKTFLYNPSQYPRRPPSTTTTPTTGGFTSMSNVVGCADAPPCTSATPIFCDMAGPGPDCLVFDAGFMGMDGIHSPFATADLSVGL